MEYKRAPLRKFASLEEKETPEGRYWRKFRNPVVQRLAASASHVEFSPVAPHDYAVTTGARVAILDYASSREKRAITKFKDVAYSGSYRSDGRLLVAGGARPLLQVFDMGSRAVLRALPGHTGAIHVARFASDNTHIFSAADDCSVRHWDMSAEACVATLERAHGDYVRCGQASPASPSLFVSGSYDHTVRLWDFRAGGGAGAAPPPRGASAAVAVAEEEDAEEDEEEEEEEGAADGSASEESDGDADERGADEEEAEEEEEEEEEEAPTPFDRRASPAAPTPLPSACALSVDHGCPVTSVLLLPGGGTLLTAGGNYVRLWDLVAGGRRLLEFSAHLKLITAMALDGTATRLLTGGLDSLIKVHELSTFAVTHTMRADAPILALAVSPDNARLVTACADASLTVRHRIAKVEEIVAEAKSARMLRGGTYRYFMRGQSTAAAADDIVAPAGAAPGGAKRRRLAVHDKHLRAFEYAAALDAAIASNNAVVVTAVLEELGARGGLRAALERRDEERLAPVLAFLVKHVANPRHAALLLEVAELVVTLYAHLLGSSSTLDALFYRLREALSKEAAVGKELIALQGSLDLLMAASTGGSGGGGGGGGFDDDDAY